MTDFGVSRGGFLAGAATLAAVAAPGAASAAIATSAAPALLSPDAIAKRKALSAPVPFVFDLEAFRAVVNRPFAHRQVSVATSFASASTALSHMERVLHAYGDPLGFDAGPDSVHVAAVLYGGYGYAIALDDAMYAKYPIASLIDEELHPVDSPYAALAAARKTNGSADAYRALVADHGASFFVCNNALSGFSTDVARRMVTAGTEPEREQVVAIHDDLVHHFLPGTMLVPAGVAALNAVQEARFTLLPE